MLHLHAHLLYYLHAHLLYYLHTYLLTASSQCFIADEEMFEPSKQYAPESLKHFLDSTQDQMVKVGDAAVPQAKEGGEASMV